MRLRLVPEKTNFNFFGRSKLWLGLSGVMVVVAFVSFLLQGLNFGMISGAAPQSAPKAPKPLILPPIVARLGRWDWAISRSPRCSTPRLAPIRTWR